MLPIGALEYIYIYPARSCGRCFHHVGAFSTCASNRASISSAQQTSFQLKGKRIEAEKPPPSKYSETLNLPKTGFPIRPDTEKRDKLFVKRLTQDLYDWQSKQLSRPLWVLHDGPPYANGHLHAGHAMNKVTKDIINRYKLLQGHRISYIPGYDTHGLPLELKALATLKQPVSSLTPQAVRAAARIEAEQGVKIQNDEFQTLGIMGAFRDNDVYRTMNWSYEKRQLGVFAEMVKKNLITNHHRPTLYSPSSQTALAEAELEYRDDHPSRSVYVALSIADQGDLISVLEPLGLQQKNIKLAVWTTTAWTLPANVAVAVSESLSYSIVKREDTQELLIVATDRSMAVGDILGTLLQPLVSFPGSVLLRTTYHPPLPPPKTGGAQARPIFSASYVSSTTGTGLVHTAPAHGVEDWQAWRGFLLKSSANKLVSDTICAVDSLGRFNENLESMVSSDVREELEGKSVLSDGTGSVIDILNREGTLLKEHPIEHKYPYGWRTKKPVIYRASNQWFVNLESIKSQALEAMKSVCFFPKRGHETLELYVKNRSEWCISRQRAWGVPIPVVYYYSAEGSDPILQSTPFLNYENIVHIIGVLEGKGKGTDYWWEGDAEEFVNTKTLQESKDKGLKWRKGLDTMDVWFDSGTSWTMLRDMFKGTPDEARDVYADLYLEGSDQHRGWFQSSLLTAIAATPVGAVPKAPYRQLLTQGMVLDERGRKMSKSLGNVMSPDTIIHGGKNKDRFPAYGTDLLRAWVASADTSKDVLIGPEILKTSSDGLKKIRNTARFMLGSINGEKADPKVLETEIGLVNRYVLNELQYLIRRVTQSYESYEFNKAYLAISSFSLSLSSFYFGIIKECLYADSKSSRRRQQVICILTRILDAYKTMLAPILPFLAEEIHHFSTGTLSDPVMNEEQAISIFESEWPQMDDRWVNSDLQKEMQDLMKVRTQLYGMMEEARIEKLMANSTEVFVIIRNPSKVIIKHADELASLFIVSGVKLERTPQTSALETLKMGVPWYKLSDCDPSPLDQSSSSSNPSEEKMQILLVPARLKKCARCWSYSRSDDEGESHDGVCIRCHQVLESQ